MNEQFDIFLKRITELHFSERNPWLRLVDIQKVESDLINARNHCDIDGGDYHILYSLAWRVHDEIKDLCE